jgi:hypothetical protein
MCEVGFAGCRGAGDIGCVGSGWASADLVLALEAVEMKKKLLPSQRGEGT